MGNKSSHQHPGDDGPGAILPPTPDINRHLPSGHTLLTAAARDGLSDSVLNLLIEGADVNRRTRQGSTALNLAAREQHEDIMDMLLDHGASVNAVDRFGCSTMDLATYYRLERMLGRLLQAKQDAKDKADSCACDDDQGVLIVQGYTHDPGRSRMVGLMDQSQIDAPKFSKMQSQNTDFTDFTEYQVSSALFTAISTCNISAVRLLIEHGANVHVKERASGCPPLLKAVRCCRHTKDRGIIELLLSHGAKVCETDARGKSALIEMISEAGRCDLVKLLMEHLRKEVGDCGWSQTLVDIFPHVVRAQCHVCVELFLDLGLDLRKRDKHNCEPIVYAYSRNAIAEKCRCNQRGYSCAPKDTDYNFCTRRHKMLEPATDAIIDLILSRGAPVTQVWDDVIHYMTKSNFSSCQPYPLIQCIRSRGTFKHASDIVTCPLFTRSLFINIAESTKPYILSHLYAAGFTPNEEESAICKRIRSLVSDVDGFGNWITKVQNTPRSLQSVATVAVRRALGDGVLALAPSLPVPRKIHDIITLKELTESNWII